MNKLMSTVASFFGVATGDDPKGARQVAKLREEAHDAYKTAARAGNVVAIKEMFAAKRIALGDELDRGRGLLQFAVMANSIKTVKMLMLAGADASAKDSLGASAVQLAKKSGESMTLAVANKAVA